MLNARVENKNLTLVFEKIFFGQNSPEINRKKRKKILDSAPVFFNMNSMGFVEFWKIISVFAQRKRVVIKF